MEVWKDLCDFLLQCSDAPPRVNKAANNLRCQSLGSNGCRLYKVCEMIYVLYWAMRSPRGLKVFLWTRYRAPGRALLSMVARHRDIYGVLRVTSLVHSRPALLKPWSLLCWHHTTNEESYC